MFTFDNYECTWELYKSIPSLNKLSTPFRNYDKVLSCDSRARHASPLQRPTAGRRGRACPALPAAKRWTRRKYVIAFTNACAK